MNMINKILSPHQKTHWASTLFGTTRILACLIYFRTRMMSNTSDNKHRFMAPNLPSYPPLLQCNASQSEFHFVLYQLREGMMTVTLAKLIMDRAMSNYPPNKGERIRSNALHLMKSSHSSGN